MPSFLDCRIDADAVLADIEAITRIESPTSDAAGVNRVLDTIAGWFEGTGAASSASRPTTTGSATCCASAAIPGATSRVSWC